MTIPASNWSNAKWDDNTWYDYVCPHCDRPAFSMREPPGFCSRVRSHEVYFENGSQPQPYAAVECQHCYYNLTPLDSARFVRRSI